MTEAKVTQRALVDCTYANTPAWGFTGLKVTAKVVKVYDGDTLTAVFDTCGAGFFRHQIRLCDIDTPEMHGKTQAEKDAAILARDYSKSLCESSSSIVTLNIKDTDKYGRLLASVNCGGIDISQAMLAHGFAVSYEGETKKPFDPAVFGKPVTRA